MNFPDYERTVTGNLPRMPDIYIYNIYSTLISESARTILRTRLKKGNRRLGKLAIDMLDGQC